MSGTTSPTGTERGFVPGIVATAVAAAAMAALSTYAWNRVPAQIPIHWNLSGTVDGYVDRTFGLLFGPGLAAMLGLLFVLLPRIDPRKQNLMRSLRAYTAVWIAALVIVTIAHVIIVLTALGHDIGVNRILTLAVGGLFVVIGNYLPKIRSNWFFGIRTPWTLSSEQVWLRTHRLGGPVFIIAGLVTMVTGVFTGGAAALFVLLGSLVGAAVLLTVYSWWTSRHERTGPEV